MPGERSRIVTASSRRKRKSRSRSRNARSRSRDRGRTASSARHGSHSRSPKRPKHSSASSVTQAINGEGSRDSRMSLDSSKDGDGESRPLDDIPLPPGNGGSSSDQPSQQQGSSGSMATSSTNVKGANKGEGKVLLERFKKSITSTSGNSARGEQPKQGTSSSGAESGSRGSGFKPGAFRPVDSSAATSSHKNPPHAQRSTGGSAASNGAPIHHDPGPSGRTVTGHASGPDFDAIQNHALADTLTDRSPELEKRSSGGGIGSSLNKKHKKHRKHGGKEGGGGEQRPSAEPQQLSSTALRLAKEDAECSNALTPSAAAERHKSINKLPPEKLEKLQEKRKQVEQAYKQDCETFATVVKMLISKDASLEDKILLSLRDSLKDIGQKFMQELNQYIDHLIDVPAHPPSSGSVNSSAKKPNDR